VLRSNLCRPQLVLRLFGLLQERLRLVEPFSLLQA